MPLKDISYLELWRPVCPAFFFLLIRLRVSRGSILCNYFEFGSVVQEKLSFEIYLLSKLLLGYRYRPLKTNIVTPDVGYVAFFFIEAPFK